MNFGPELNHIRMQQFTMQELVFALEFSWWIIAFWNSSDLDQVVHSYMTQPKTKFIVFCDTLYMTGIITEFLC